MFDNVRQQLLLIALVLEFDFTVVRFDIFTEIQEKNQHLTAESAKQRG